MNLNLKLKFVTSFTVFVALILIVVSYSVYLFYDRYQQADFYKRLKEEGLFLYEQYNTIKPKTKDSVLQKNRLSQPRKSLYEEEVVFLDADKNITYKEPASNSFQLSQELVTHLPQTADNDYRFQEGGRSYLALLTDDKYIIVSAIDKGRAEQLNSLSVILIFVFLGGLILTALFSFLFIRSAFKPLAGLSMQMQQTTETNLTERASEGKGNDEIYQITRNFNSMLERLNQSFESQKSFVHHASHELRTPLATMLSQTEAALSKDLSVEEYKQLLESLKQDQVGMIDLTNSLLLLSQYEKIMSSSKWPLLRIDEVLYETISNARRMLPAIEVDIEFANIPDDESRLMVLGNEALLKVAFTNLIKNAWQYSTDKKVFITIDITENGLNVYFENNGKQLTASEIEKLNVPFFRGDNAVHVKGFGLGLSIVQRIISLHLATFDYKAIKPSINRFSVYFKRKAIA
jgi:signal transduction histidine kinase